MMKNSDQDINTLRKQIQAKLEMKKIESDQ